MNSVLVVSSQNPNDVKAEGTLGQPNYKEDLDPKNDRDTASFVSSSAEFTNEHNDQED